MRIRTLLPSSRGFTLMELLVALLVSGIVMTALLTFYHYQIGSMRLETARRAAQVTTRGTLHFMVRHLESLGRDPGGLLFTPTAPALQVADAEELHYGSNLSEDPADNDTLDPWEDVVFAYDSATAAIQVTTTDGGGSTTYALTDESATPTSYVPAGGLLFTYYDGDGNVVAPGGGATDRARIRRIHVSITVHGVPPGNYAEPEVTLAQDVYLRNVS